MQEHDPIIFPAGVEELINRRFNLLRNDISISSFDW